MKEFLYTGIGKVVSEVLVYFSALDTETVADLLEARRRNVLKIQDTDLPFRQPLNPLYSEYDSVRRDV